MAIEGICVCKLTLSGDQGGRGLISKFVKDLSFKYCFLSLPQRVQLRTIRYFLLAKRAVLMAPWIARKIHRHLSMFA